MVCIASYWIAVVVVVSFFLGFFACSILCIAKGN